jgi:transposase
MKKEVLMQWLGIDVSKSSFSCYLATLSSDLKKNYEQGCDLGNDTKGYDQLAQWLSVRIQDPERFIVVMEATGVYHQALALNLYQRGYKVSIMQSGRVKRYAQSLVQRSKTDALDSKKLSMLGCERELPLWEPPREVLSQLKALSRERSTLIRERVTSRNRLESIECSSYKNTREIGRYLKRIALIECQIMEVEAEMRELVSRDGELREGLEFLESIPGISFISAATVIGETLGFNNITNAKQLTSYAGYDVVIRESGTYKGKSSISKKGNRNIRGVLHMPSMTAVRINPTLKPFYQRLKPNKAKPIVALIAVQRKLLVLMYSLWKNQMYYDPEYAKRSGKNIEPLPHRIESILN